MLTQLTSYILAISVGSCAGFFYGLLFMYQKKGALFNTKRQNTVQHLLNQIFVTSIRFGLIALSVWYLLPWPKIHFILIMISFFVLYWIVVIQYKGYPDDRT